MSSNLRVNNILPSVGTNVAIGTAGGSITLTGSTTGDITSSGVSTFSNIRITGGTISGVSTAGITTVYTNSVNGGQLGGSRNIIINGSMVVNQRGWTGAAGTTTNTAYTTDRFLIQFSHDGAVSAGQTSMNSTVGGAAYADGFQNALFFKVTTADATLGASQFQYIAQQRIEGYNVQGIKKGTANAQPVTLSFWCRSTTIGTYIAELFDGDNTRQCSQAYTINAANTWEKKTLTYPADTTGVFDNNNALSLYVLFWGAAGSDYSSGTLNTSWASNTDTNRAVGQTNLLATAGNDFWLTGVQLEVGDRATEFERRSFGDELRLCQRYYWQIKNTTGSRKYLGMVQAYASNATYGILTYVPVELRGSPTVGVSGGFGFYNAASGTASTTSPGDLAYSSQRIESQNWGGATGLTAGDGLVSFWENNAVIYASAEL